MTDLTADDVPSWINCIWDALQNYREKNIPDTDEFNEEWNDITTAMSWVTETLGFEYDANGDLVLAPDTEGMTDMEYEHRQNQRDAAGYNWRVEKRSIMTSAYEGEK